MHELIQIKRFHCRACGERKNHKIFFKDNKKILIKCPNCLREGVVRKLY